MSSHDEEARDGSWHAANRRTGHFRPAARTLFLASVSLSLIGCRDPAVPASAPSQSDDARAHYDRGNNSLAEIVVTNNPSTTVYTGLAAGTFRGKNYIYAVNDIASPGIEVYNDPLTSDVPGQLRRSPSSRGVYALWRP